MKHKFQCIRDEMDKIYGEFDSFSMFRIVYDEIERFNKHYYDNYYNFNKDTPAKRLQRTEGDLIDAFFIKYQYSCFSKKQAKQPI